MARLMHTWRNGQDSNLAPLAYARECATGSASIPYVPLRRATKRSGYEVDPGEKIRTSLQMDARGNVSKSPHATQRPRPKEER